MFASVIFHTRSPPGTCPHLRSTSSSVHGCTTRHPCQRQFFCALGRSFAAVVPESCEAAAFDLRPFAPFRPVVRPIGKEDAGLCFERQSLSSLLSSLSSCAKKTKKQSFSLSLSSSCQASKKCLCLCRLGHETQRTFTSVAETSVGVHHGLETVDTANTQCAQVDWLVPGPACCPHFKCWCAVF